MRERLLLPPPLNRSQFLDSSRPSPNGSPPPPLSPRMAPRPSPALLPSTSLSPRTSLSPTTSLVLWPSPAMMAAVCARNATLSLMAADPRLSMLLNAELVQVVPSAWLMPRLGSPSPHHPHQQPLFNRFPLVSWLPLLEPTPSLSPSWPPLRPSPLAQPPSLLHPHHTTHM